MVSGGGSSSKSKSQSQSTQESGTKFNQEFLDEMFSYFDPNRKVTARRPGGFDAERYLRENPDVAGFKDGPYEHWVRHGQAEGRKYPGDPGVTEEEATSRQASPTGPTYDPSFVRTGFTPTAFTGSGYTGSTYTPVEGGDFDKLERNLYDTQKSRIRQAYESTVGRQREELNQMEALNSPAQYLEGSARSSLDRGFLDNLQQAARDASSMSLGLKAQEAARRTGYDVGEAGRRTGYDVGEATRRTGYDVSEAGRRTGYDVGEAGRETEFNEQTSARLIELFLKKLGIALDSGKYGFGESSGQSSGSGTSANFGILGMGTAR